MPEAGRPTFDINDDQMEMGVGIHGEPGRKRLPMASADEIAAKLMEPILNDLSPAGGERALLLVNGFGATPLMELTLMYDAARRAMSSSGIEVAPEPRRKLRDIPRHGRLLDHALADGR